jgi:hypothetical protein
MHSPATHLAALALLCLTACAAPNAIPQRSPDATPPSVPLDPQRAHFPAGGR